MLNDLWSKKICRPKIIVWSPVLHSSLDNLVVIAFIIFCVDFQDGEGKDLEEKGTVTVGINFLWNGPFWFLSRLSPSIPPLSPSPSDYTITTTITTTIKATITTIINVTTTNTTISLIIIIIRSSVMMNIAEKQLQWCKNMICSSELFSFEKIPYVFLNFPFSANQKPAKTLQDPHWLRRAF